LITNFSKNIHDLRQKRNLTQFDLAKLSGVPRSTIAHIEGRGGNPTLSVMSELSLALQISLEELLSPPQGLCRVYAVSELEKKVYSRASGKVTISRLLPGPKTSTDFERLEMAANTRHRGIPHRPGTREYLYCEKGEMTLWVGGEKFVISAGEVASFPGDQVHSYENTTTSKALGFSVITLSPLIGR